MIGVAQAYSPTYRDARAAFLNAAASLSLPIDSRAHPLLGAQGEDLAMDVVFDGAANATRLLIVSSACHGVEGFCGSGVQAFALHDEDWRSKAREQGVAVLYIHALNPHGFSFKRRVTQENVDLNRNFQDFSQALPVNEDYAEIHARLLPADWPPDAANMAAVQADIARVGLAAWQGAVTRGQYAFADGLFFGGHAPTWSNTTLRAVLRQYGQGKTHAAWIDLHTGLGRSGHGERIYAGPDDAPTYARANQWWGGAGATPVTSIYNGSSTSAWLTGLMWCCAAQEMPRCSVTGIALEYGTLEITQMIEALRADHWLHQNPAASAKQAALIKQQILDAFYVNTDAWKGQVISQARQAMFQAVDGLSAT